MKNGKIAQNNDHIITLLKCMLLMIAFWLCGADVTHRKSDGQLKKSGLGIYK
jgi:hypothetical protein